MPHYFTTLSTLAVLTCSAFAAGDTWTSDYEAAKKRAAAEGKDLLIDFTGSDWCSWCIKLRKEVFEQPEFAKANEKFILVELDYPKDKSRLTEAVVAQNETLLKQYPIKGYPTVLLCDASGKPFGAGGYQPGGPAEYLPMLDGLLAKKAGRDRAIAEAGTKEGVEKAKLLIGAMEDMGLDEAMANANYAELSEQIRKADPADETGFARKQDGEKKFAEFMMKLGEFRSKQDLDGAMKFVEETLAKKELQGEHRQNVYGHQAGTLASAGKKDEAIAVLRKAVAEEPNGPQTKELENFIVILEKEKERSATPPAAPKEKTD